MCFRTPKGFKSIAVGKRCDAHGGSEKRLLPWKGQTVPENVTPSGSGIFLLPIRGLRATLAHGY